MTASAATKNKVFLTPGNAQWIGTRGEQQDAFGFHGFDDLEFSTHGGMLAVLADGMGGLQNGRAAAQTAVAILRQAYAEKAPEESIPDALQRALEAANAAVYQLAITSDGEGQVGTTLVAAVAHHEGIYWVAAGDSRLYGYRADTDNLSLLSQEHNYAAILQARVAQGAVDQADADENPERDALTSFLGLEDIPLIDSGTDLVPLSMGDRLLLCSDGVHGSLDAEDLRQLIRQPAQQAAEAIVSSLKAVAKPTQDNATLAILAAEASPPDQIELQSPGPQHGAMTSPRQEMTGTRQFASRLSKLIIGIGLALVLVLIGIAIGMSLRNPGKQEPAKPPEDATQMPESSVPNSEAGASMRDSGALEAADAQPQPVDSQIRPPAVPPSKTTNMEAEKSVPAPEPEDE
ncbi:protein phosphatase 2C domain-containing protein [Thiorhodovibrio frisius]|uniref:Serine/threonine protein phosphatase n=1 Tax=Thiorhodovibrio frisius TaxID=631362 RepID=H8YZZ7_9GAMM|nr:protein phosphatase 2C domain-containing protein [Thiorhodovibrio frisius]EIC21170.1 serine/threonine protein phosphatase [Thiorhodovibrio frisius]WPL23746.1 Serine/threonine phosphatase stp [Thiorhodovibrio frisius]